MGRVGVGVGDMTKAVYDPDKDGKLALLQLVNAVCSETEAGTIADGKITTHTGLLTAIHGTILVIKATDETVNNSTVLQNDDHLVFAVEANSIYIIEMALTTLSDTTAPDIDFIFAKPAGGIIRSLQAFVTPPGYHSLGRADTELSSISAASTPTYVYFKLVYWGGENAGNIQFQWAQHVATVEDTKILENSFLVAKRYA